MGQDMNDETKPRRSGGGGSPVYGIGMFGAWAWFFRGAATPEEYGKAFLKGLFWPAFLVYGAFAALAGERGER